MVGARLGEYNYLSGCGWWRGWRCRGVVVLAAVQRVIGIDANQMYSIRWLLLLIKIQSFITTLFLFLEPLLRSFINSRVNNFSIISQWSTIVISAFLLDLLQYTLKLFQVLTLEHHFILLILISSYITRLLIDLFVLHLLLLIDQLLISLLDELVNALLKVALAHAHCVEVVRFLAIWSLSFRLYFGRSWSRWVDDYALLLG